MSIPPVPNHPPRPGRRKPAEESPDSITTQLFIGQERSADADGSTQALSAEELERLRSMVSADGAEATEVLSLEELRELARAEGREDDEAGAEPPRASSLDIAAATAAAEPKPWNPQSPGHSASPQGSGRPVPGPPPVGAPAHGASPGQPSQQTYRAPAPGYPGAFAAGGQTGPAGPGGPVGPEGGYPGGPAGPGRREPETKKVPAWLWVLASIALVAALGIVGYIAWDSLQGRDTVATGPTTGAAPTDPAPDTQDPETSAPPQASESFSSPSGNISCTIDPERARCVISAYEYQPPEKPADCQLENWGSIVVANSDSAGFSCREAPTPNGPTRVLGYGESVSSEGMTCTSTREGMSCTSDSTGVGFTVRRAGVDFTN